MARGRVKVFEGTGTKPAEQEGDPRAAFGGLFGKPPAHAPAPAPAPEPGPKPETAAEAPVPEAAPEIAGVPAAEFWAGFDPAMEGHPDQTAVAVVDGSGAILGTQTIEAPAKSADELRREMEDFLSGKTNTSVNAATLTEIDPRFGPVTTILFDDEDWVAFSREFEDWLSMGDRRSEEGFIRKAHEAGPRMLRRANKIYLQVKNAREKWEAENDVVLGSMRELASQSLEDEKKAGERKKTITEADIKARAATLFQDEWPRQESRRREYKAVEARAAHDVEVAAIRCKNLDMMMSRLH